MSPGLTELQRIAEFERKIGQLTMENDFLKKALQHFKDHHLPAVVSLGVQFSFPPGDPTSAISPSTAFSDRDIAKKGSNL